MKILMMLAIFFIANTANAWTAPRENVVIKIGGKKSSAAQETSVQQDKAPAAAENPLAASNKIIPPEGSKSVRNDNPSAALNHARHQEIKNKMMEQLKKTNPELYARHLKNRERSEKISRITSAYRKGELSEEQARKQLTPLIEESFGTDNYLKNIDRQIDNLEAQIKRLKKIKTSPQLLVEERVNSYLGKPPNSTTKKK